MEGGKYRLDLQKIVEPLHFEGSLPVWKSKPLPT
jgi:hypothetical protein